MHLYRHMEQLTLEKILHTDWLQWLCKWHQQFLLGIFDPIFAVYMNWIIRHNYLYNPEKKRNHHLDRLFTQLEDIIKWWSYFMLPLDPNIITGRDTAVQFHWGANNFSSVYCRISNYGNFYFLDAIIHEWEDVEKNTELVKALHILFQNQYGLTEISIHDPILDAPINIFWESHGSQIYSMAHKELLWDILLNFTEDDIDWWFQSQSLKKDNKLSIGTLACMWQETYESILKKNEPKYPVLVNVKNELVTEQFNIRDLLFGEYW